MRNPINNIRYLSLILKVTIAVSIALLIASMFFPAFSLDYAGYTGAMDSKTVFFLGWLSFLEGDWLIWIIWFANVFYVAAFIMMLRSKKDALLLSVLAFALACCFTRVGSVVTSLSGANTKVTTLRIGYWLWLGSMATLAFGAWADGLAKKWGVGE